MEGTDLDRSRSLSISTSQPVADESISGVIGKGVPEVPLGMLAM
jgi:hypothetical protein